MTVTNGYCSVEDVRDQLDDTSNTLDTSLIEKAVSASSRAIDRWCGRRFWQDPDPVARLYAADCAGSLDVADISTMEGLTVETDAAASGTWTTLGPASYHLEPLNADADGGAYAWWTIAADSPSGFSVSRRPLVRVTARWGWSQIPDQVVEAAVLKAVSLFKRKDAPFGVAGFGDFGAVRITRRDPDVLDLLAPFRVPPVA